MSQRTVPIGELRTVALADIHVQDGFKREGPLRARRSRRAHPLDRRHGVLQPVVVAVDGNGYRLLAGERRYRAAKAAGLEELPAFVRDTGGASGLDLAVVENVMRQDLDPLQEARAYQRLIDELGLTRRGVAEHLGVAQKRVTA